MRHQVTEQWDEEMWLQAEPVYEEAFPEHGRKNKGIIVKMFERGLCELHVWYIQAAPVAMALTGTDSKESLLVIDYIAVSRHERGKGLGLACLEDLKRWAKSRNCRGIVIEAEADPSEENAKRIAFWKKAGYTATDYVHTYIWVPETYKAMYVSLDVDSPIESDDNGKNVFESILRYHEKAYRNKKQSGDH
ncbi:GNAT family N-acetyltransferase [Paenibacillus dokdonensis]|uniref:GNAT family N-acetyltransferase n=1 Tax=Paenibacillus dokdonensis TaxID=2567944 RepID=UPI0010A76F43|nr:GNAT family N-acetyltransferase [Paenibacillus dokdonensis]